MVKRDGKGNDCVVIWEQVANCIPAAWSLHSAFQNAVRSSKGFKSTRSLRAFDVISSSCLSVVCYLCATHHFTSGTVSNKQILTLQDGEVFFSQQILFFHTFLASNVIWLLPKNMILWYMILKKRPFDPQVSRYVELKAKIPEVI